MNKKTKTIEEPTEKVIDPSHYVTWGYMPKFKVELLKEIKKVVQKDIFRRRLADKTLSIKDPADFDNNIKTHGKNLWVCISKAYNEAENWMKSTKVMEIKGQGCLVQVTTQQGDQIAEALTYVPKVRLNKAKMELEGF